MTKGELHLYEDKGVMRVCSASKIPLVRYIFLFLTSEKKYLQIWPNAAAVTFYEL